MRKNRKLSVRGLFVLVLVAAVLIKLWPSFLILAEAAEMYVESVNDRAVMNEKLEKLNTAKGNKLQPDFGPEMKFVVCK